MKVAIVHDWLVTYRGGEKVLEALCEMYPSAPIYTLFYCEDELPAFLRQRKVVAPAFLAKWFRYRKFLLPFLPSFIESFDLDKYDLILSTSSCVAKGAVCAPEARHVSYIHSPMRYIWDQRTNYLPRRGVKAVLMHWVAHYMRIWDYMSSQRIDTLVANSNFVAKRISRYYSRDSVVIPPPVDVDFFELPEEVVERTYYLCFGALVPYKRFDLVVRSASGLKYKLIVAGKGEELERLKRMVPQGVQVDFIENPSQGELKRLYQGARALIFPGLEDFGIVPIEAMCCGTPVIAYGAGGALDYVVPGITGVLFEQQTTAALIDAVDHFEQHTFDPGVLQNYAEKYSKQAFQHKMRELLEG
ncbi:MAG: glycosyltransferase [Zetaproteobacteria bacterium]|nr:glycosyltransferase [Zetaproteobacteria bacterium]